MIEIQNIEFSWPRSSFRLAIDQLKVGAGEKLAIIGPSGSGKTTLLDLISGIETVDQGILKVDGVELSELSDAHRRDFRCRRIGFVFQQFELLDYLTVEENIRLPFLINRNIESSDRSHSVAESINRLASQMGIHDKLQRHPRKLSQGEKQRVAICRALVTEPRLILADEPTGNLDPNNKHRTLDLLFEQAQQNGQTLIVVTHDMGIVDGFDRSVDFTKFYAQPDQSETAEASA